ncbi:MAG: CBS domain-containing protein [Lachnospiraceae bacterium]|jgi:CBS domain-containing protein|nr:CBS domain-containing protein [Lachnospiraceae bacterium]
MNILFFLTPKKEVACLHNTDSLRQALEKMEHRRYAAIPIIHKKTGTYVGTLTEGDLLWDIKNRGIASIREAEEISVMDVRRNRDNQPVSADAKMEDLINLAMSQNFVPVIDGGEHFIGIVTRKDIIQYLVDQQK